jgi:hypothetical protein
MLGVGRGRPERGHLASTYSTGSGGFDTGIVPKALPCGPDYKFPKLYGRCALCSLTISSICVMRTLGRSLIVRPWPFTSEVNTGLANPG